MYSFQDRGERSLTLRPEGTAPVVRSYVENKMFGDATQPTKLYYIGQMFRYERPQVGRYRQFVYPVYDILLISQFACEKNPLIATLRIAKFRHRNHELMGNSTIYYRILKRRFSNILRQSSRTINDDGCSV